MKPEISIRKLKSAVQVKIKGDLIIQYGSELKEKLLEAFSSGGSLILSIKEITAIDAATVQLIISLQRSLISTNRLLTISWPVDGPVLELLSKTGIKQILK